MDELDFVSKGDLPPGYSTDDRDGLYAVLDARQRVVLYAFYVQGECRASLSLDQDREYGRFVGDMAGEIYFRHSIEMISPWHDNAAPKPTDRSLRDWALGCIQYVYRAAMRHMK